MPERKSMKNILITGGPTNEPVDQVMKITNMSTGSLSVKLAQRALDKGDRVTLIINHAVTRSAAYEKLTMHKNAALLKTVGVETTMDMYDALKAEASEKYDVIIHAAAVGDYRPEFSFRLEDMAKELAEALVKNHPKNRDDAEKMILAIMEDPDCRVKDDSKISSYEPNLTVKLGLTTKLISNLRAWYPNAYLIGCKLLENVTKEHLIEVAHKLCVKNDMDLIMANDLAQIRRGEPVRHLVNSKGYTGISLEEEGGPALLDYAEENWF